MPPRKPATTPDPSPPKRKRRWKRRLLITGLILVVLGAIANGPGARWFLDRTVRKQLSKLGLEGDLTVEGRVSSGFSLTNGKFTGQSTQAEISFGKLSIDYRFLELFGKKIRRIEGKNIKIVSLAKEKPKDKKFTMPDLDAIGTKIRGFRTLLRPIIVDVENVDYQLIPLEGEPIKVTLGALKHPADSNLFNLTNFSSNALGPNGLPAQDIRLRWLESELVLDQLNIFPDLTLGSTRVNYEEGSPVELFAPLIADSAHLIAFADSSGTVEIDLNNSSLDLAKTVGSFLPDLKLGGEVSHLHLRADHLLDDLSKWDLVLNLKGADLAWQNGTLPTLSADVVLADRARLIVNLGDGLETRLNAENPLRKASPKDNPDWWKDITGDVELNSTSIHQSMTKVFAALGKEVPDLAKIPDGATSLKADFLTGGPLKVQVPNLDWSLSDPKLGDLPLPAVKGTASLQEQTAALTMTLAEPRENETLTIEGSYNLKEKSYTGKLVSNLPDTNRLKPFLPGDSPNWKPTDGMAFTWTGHGSLPDSTHQGSAEVTKLTIKSPGGTGKTTLSLSANYNWPKELQIPSLAINNGDLTLGGSLSWKDNRLDIPSLQLDDASGPLLTIKGALPLTTTALSIDEIFAVKDPLDLSLVAKNLKLKRLRELLPLNIPPDITAVLDGNLTFGGTPAKPIIGGTLRATNINLPKDLPSIDTELILRTENGALFLDGKVNESAGRVVTINGKLPLTTEKWVKNPESFRQVPLDLTAKIDKFALPRLQFLNPVFAKAEGTLTTEFRLTGTPAKPNLNGNANIALSRFPLENTPYRNVRDANIQIRLEGKRIIIQPSTALVAGGKFTLSGDVTLGGEQPLLNIGLLADHALFWRNDSFVLRSNGNLKLAGPFNAARLSGNLNLVESLYYKDIEIIPVGVPTTSAPKPKLPSIDKADSKKSFNVPAPFDAWTLDLTLKTADPILIRGNVATGEINADTRITGTFANPRPSGKFIIKEAIADLPFSKLKIKNGSIILQPDDPLNPVIDIRGTSTINNQRVNLYLYGSLSNPKYNLASDRGLAESEILTLLATGATSADLEDPELAKSKAFQLFIDDLRRRSNKPGGNKLFRNVLNELDEVDLKVGENDPFSGRKFNSATLQIEDRWYLSASVDNAGNTRGLVIFSMRFK